MSTKKKPAKPSRKRLTPEEAKKLLLGFDADHLRQALVKVTTARTLVAEAIFEVGQASVSSASPKKRVSQRALLATAEALHTAYCVLENEHDSAASGAQKASP